MKHDADRSERAGSDATWPAGVDPPAGWDRFRRATEMRHAGKLEEAAAEFRALAESAESDENRGLCMISEAYCLGELRRVEDARHVLRAAKGLSPGDEEYELRVGLAEACLAHWGGDPAEALKRFDRLCDVHAELLTTGGLRDLYEIIQTMRGVALVDLRRYADARPALERALALGGAKESEFYCKLGVCYYSLREYHLAKQALTRALEGEMTAGWTIAARYHLGLAHRALGAVAWARRELEAALALAQGHRYEPHIHRELAETCRRLGLREEARRHESLARDG